MVKSMTQGPDGSLTIPSEVFETLQSEKNSKVKKFVIAANKDKYYKKSGKLILV
ncbi:MAG: hypothetical protein MZU97_11000 [Bacillus subtilis]|nr:hypothetical protein [Bacillus subtilis]